MGVVLRLLREEEFDVLTQRALVAFSSPARRDNHRFSRHSQSYHCPAPEPGLRAPPRKVRRPLGRLSTAPGEQMAGEGKKWPFLDLVRAGSALLVMLGHARSRFFPEFAAVADPGPLTKVFYLLT